MITCATVSSSKDVVFGVSIVGGIHSNAISSNWKVSLFSFHISIGQYTFKDISNTFHSSYISC